jgi:hypothetical protein
LAQTFTHSFEYTQAIKALESYITVAVKNICFFSKYGGRKSPNHDSEFVEAGIRNSRILLDGFSHVGFGRLLGTLKTKSRNYKYRMISSKAFTFNNHQYTHTDRPKISLS